MFVPTVRKGMLIHVLLGHVSLAIGVKLVTHVSTVVRNAVIEMYTKLTYVLTQDNTPM